MGVDFEVCSVDVDEHMEGHPKQIVAALAEKKARAAFGLHPGETILGSDTLVFCEGAVLGKPTDESDALRMLLLLSGRKNSVFTGVCVINGETGLAQVAVDVTDVFFQDIDQAAALRYIESGEPMDKAGAYGAQGMGGMFVKSICGSPSNVIGLPMHLVRDMLRSIGWEL